jgi:hypothetical protein
MVLAEIIIRIVAEEDGEELQTIVEAVIIEEEEAIEVVKIIISHTVEAQMDPRITINCVLSCQSQEDASRVHQNAHTFTMTNPINKFKEEAFRAICHKTIWEEILEIKILNKG